MSLFGTLSALTQAAVGVVTLPVSAVADVVTLGGVLTDKKETYTGKRAKDVMDALDDAVDGREGHRSRTRSMYSSARIVATAKAMLRWSESTTR